MARCPFPKAGKMPESMRAFWTFKAGILKQNARLMRALVPDIEQNKRKREQQQPRTVSELPTRRTEQPTAWLLLFPLVEWVRQMRRFLGRGNAA